MVEQAGAATAEQERANEQPGFSLETRRYFVAARTPKEDIPTILNQSAEEIGQGFNSLDPQAEHRYNEIDQIIDHSIDERRRHWEGKEFSVAMKEWKKTFAEAVKQEVENQEVKTAAIRSIIPEENTELRGKNLSDITEADAETLYNLYSAGNTSNVDDFIKRAIEGVTEKRIVEGGAIEERINLETLEARLNRLEWVATGFFGKDTAATVRNQIRLEAITKKNWDDARDIFKEKPSQEPEASEAAAPQPTTAAPPDPAPVLGEQMQPAPARTDEDDEVGEGNPNGSDAQPDAEAATPQDEAENPPSQDAGHNADEKPASPDDQAAQDASASVATQEKNESRENTTEDSSIPKSLQDVDIRITEQVANEPNFNLIEEINKELSLKNRFMNKSHVYIAASPKMLMNYIISSLAGGMKVEPGEINVTPDDEININEVKISEKGGVVTLKNVSVINDPDNPGRILVNAGGIDKNLIARGFAGDVEGKISSVNDVALEKLKTQINRNLSLQPNSLSILEGNIVVGFEKEKTALPNAA